MAYGKVLDDDTKTLASGHSLKEDDQVIAMVLKAKKVAKPKQEEVKKEEGPTTPETKPQTSSRTDPVPSTESSVKTEVLSAEMEDSIT